MKKISLNYLRHISDFHLGPGNHPNGSSQSVHGGDGKGAEGDYKFKKNDIVEYRSPNPDEIGLRFKLIEDPDGDRVLGEAIVPMRIKPTYILKLNEIKPVK